MQRANTEILAAPVMTASEVLSDYKEAIQGSFPFGFAQGQDDCI